MASKTTSGILTHRIPQELQDERFRLRQGSLDQELHEMSMTSRWPTPHDLCEIQFQCEVHSGDRRQDTQRERTHAKKKQNVNETSKKGKIGSFPKSFPTNEGKQKRHIVRQ